MVARYEEIETSAGARGGRESERYRIELDPLEADDILTGRARILTVADDSLAAVPSTMPPRVGGKTSITVTWVRPLPPTGDPDDLLGYEVAWRTSVQVGYPLTQRRPLDPDVTAVQLNGLRPNTVYYVKMVAYFRASGTHEPFTETAGPGSLVLTDVPIGFLATVTLVDAYAPLDLMADAVMGSLASVAMVQEVETIAQFDEVAVATGGLMATAVLGGGSRYVAFSVGSTVDDPLLGLVEL